MESDVTVTRLSHTEYAVTSSTAQGTRDADWIRKQIRMTDSFVPHLPQRVALRQNKHTLNSFGWVQVRMSL